MYDLGNDIPRLIALSQVENLQLFVLPSQIVLFSRVLQVLFLSRKTS